jgi:hypothetical protein
VFEGNDRRIVVAAIAFAALFAGCGDGDADGDATERRAGDEAAVAATLCGALREQTNALVRIANDAVAGIEGKSPDERWSAIVAGFDAAIVAAADFAAAVPDVDLGDVDEAGALLTEVRAGALSAITELEDERAAFVEEVPAVADGEVRGRVGQFFNSVEKAMSVAEPAIARYERRALQEAFLADETCRHVIQPFRLD